jgi:selenocysteine lyase/cysteine desulfurase
VGADLSSNTVIFGKNTTEAVNKLSYRLPLSADSVVLTTLLEHHSNDLPWRSRAQVVHVGATPEGRLDLDDFDRKLAQYAGRLALVTVSGASNVTGFIQPVHDLARKAHAHGARILVDAAQLAPHRSVDMRSDDDQGHLDFVVLSAHKMYAPFGTGALIGPQEVFLQSGPNTAEGNSGCGHAGRSALGGRRIGKRPAAPRGGRAGYGCRGRALMQVGMDSIAEHEAELAALALEAIGGDRGSEFRRDRSWAG